ncbi:MAG: helix-turn-helix domain-containing protein [Phocaeicola sp.]
MNENLSFEAMPQAIMELMRKMDCLQKDVNLLKEKRPKETVEPLIEIDEACKLIHKAKSTIYALARERKIPYYKPGKMLQFKRSELMAWVETSRRTTSMETKESMLNEMQRTVRHKPQSNWNK